MKLLEQQRAPIAVLGVVGHKLISPSPKQRGSQFSLTKKPFQAAVVPFLIRPTGRATPMQLEIKLIPPDRQGGAARLQVIEVGAQRSRLLGHCLRLALPKPELFQHLGSGTATVISNTREPNRLLHPSRSLKSALLFCDRDRISIGANRWQHQR